MYIQIQKVKIKVEPEIMITKEYRITKGKSMNMLLNHWQRLFSKRPNTKKKTGVENE